MISIVTTPYRAKTYMNPPTSKRRKLRLRDVKQSFIHQGSLSLGIWTGICPTIVNVLSQSFNNNMIRIQRISNLLHLISSIKSTFISHDWSCSCIYNAVQDTVIMLLIMCPFNIKAKHLYFCHCYEMFIFMFLSFIYVSWMSSARHINWRH